MGVADGSRSNKTILGGPDFQDHHGDIVMAPGRVRSLDEGIADLLGILASSHDLSDLLVFKHGVLPVGAQ